MINWKEINGLHVVTKLKSIVSEWFGADIVFIDKHFKQPLDHGEFSEGVNCGLFKSLLEMKFGREFLSQDLEAIGESLREGGQPLDKEIFLKGLSAFAVPVVIENELLGAVVAYPLAKGPLTPADKSKLIGTFEENGIARNDVEELVNSQKAIPTGQLNHFHELVELVAEEVKTFHQEITKRDDQIQDLNSELGEKYRYHSMIGKSKKMQAVYRLLEKISRSDASVLIQGENGTGKELVGKAVHFGSDRKDRIFLAVNCSAFNENILDSELFGHVKGAFTGAVKDKKGLFEQADGGTLFLDEIGDTSLSMQVKLLRVLQEGTFIPVGSTVPRKVDVRVIAATNRDLKTMMQTGEFREDLFYRINVINVDLPPLRDRAEDLNILVDFFLDKRCAEEGLAKKSLSKKCLEKVFNYPWPGNVRELENEIERLVVLAGPDKLITPDLLSQRILDHGAPSGVAALGINTSGSLKKAQQELEILMIREGLNRCNFNKSKLSKELGISRASLIMKVDKYELDKRNKHSA